MATSAPRAAMIAAHPGNEPVSKCATLELKTRTCSGSSRMLMEESRSICRCQPWLRLVSPHIVVYPDPRTAFGLMNYDTTLPIKETQAFAHG